MTDTEVFFNPFAEGHAENPYPQFATMRDADPIHHNPFGIWMVFCYEDVRALLRNPALSVDERKAHPTPLTEVLVQEFSDVAELGMSSMLNVDPPDHTRLRRLVSKAFTPRMIERLRGRVEQLVDESLDRAATEGGMDLMDDLAFTLPFAVITDLLGMPPTDTAELRRLSGLVVRSLEPIADLEVFRSIIEGARELQVLIADAIEWKRSRLEDDLLSALIAAEDDGDKLSEPELREQVALLYLAGHETTVNLIGNSVLALLRAPDQLQILREDPSLDPTVVDEFLRFDSPVQMTRRVTLGEMEVGGKVIEEGAMVILGLASANRDPRRWGPTADRLDVRRDAAHHVSFGGGHHHCLGASLARLEGQVAIGRLVRRFPRLEQAGELAYNGRLNLRGLSTLPLAVGG